jgi:ribosomal protein L37AE/L43A
MLYGNQIEKVFLSHNIGNKQTRKKPRHKKFKCHSCGSDMVFVEGTNVMACSNCDKYFIFDN